MSFLISHSLFACCILAFYFAFNILRKMDFHYVENVLLFFSCIGSGVWSLGFYEIMIQTDPDVAYYWRLVGMAGVFSFLIFVTMLITYLAGIKKSIRRMIYGYSSLGIILYFGLAQKDLVEYKKAFFGMSYSFLPSVWNNLYTAYSVILAVIITISLFFLLKRTKKKRLRVLARKLLLADFIVVIGMVFDTILPVLGLQAFPGSTLGQFVSLIVLYNAVVFTDKSRIKVDNISKFIYSSIDLPVVMYDSDKKLCLTNNCADTFLELNKDDIGKNNIDSLFEFKTDIFDFEEKRIEMVSEFKPKGTQCNLTINKVFDDYDDLIGYIVFIKDITKQMKTIEQLEEAIAEADHANQAKSVFLANMSHEIRTPIHAIIGFSEIVLKSDINSQVRSYIEDIKLSSNNLLVLINDILDLSKIESGKMELVPTNYYTTSLIKDVSLIITTQAQQKGLELTMDIDDELPTKMYGDKVRLRGVIINILNNAVKYTNKGSISFKAKISKREGKRIWLEFVVKDTGIGIREEDLPNLFKKFERLDSMNNYNVEGSGLGLSIANGYVKLMGGEIRVNSVYGEGTEFTIVVPQDVVDETPFDKNFVYDKGNSSSSQRFFVDSIDLLVVDDNKVNLRMAQGLFGSYGFNVDIADGGQKAIDICTEKCYPLVFMDQMMPQVDGIEAMQEIRKRNPYYDYGNEGKIIVLTADAISGAREKLLKKGFDEYIGKPFDVKKLENIILQFVPADKIIYEEVNVSDDDSKVDEVLLDLEQKLPNLDVRTGASYCDNDAEEFLEILKIVYDFGEKRINELQGFRTSKDYKNFTILVHSLKSNAKNIGAMEAAQMAQELENAGNNSDYDYIEEHCSEFLETYSEIIKSIHLVLEEYGLLESTESVEKNNKSNDEDYIEEGDCPEHEIFLSKLDMILEYIDNFETDKVFEILDELEECVLRSDDKVIFDSIKRAMNDLEVDEVCEIIQGIAAY